VWLHDHWRFGDELTHVVEENMCTTQTKRSWPVLNGEKRERKRATNQWFDCSESGCETDESDETSEQRARGGKTPRHRDIRPLQSEERLRLLVYLLSPFSSHYRSFCRRQSYARHRGKYPRWRSKSAAVACAHTKFIRIKIIVQRRTWAVSKSVNHRECKVIT